MSAPEVVSVVSIAPHTYADQSRPVGAKYLAESRFLPPMLHLGWVKRDDAPTEKTERVASTLPIQPSTPRRSKKLGKKGRFQ